jgi:hypothetical protein
VPSWPPGVPARPAACRPDERSTRDTRKAARPPQRWPPAARAAAPTPGRTRARGPAALPLPTPDAQRKRGWGRARMSQGQPHKARRLCANARACTHSGVCCCYCGGSGGGGGGGGGVCVCVIVCRVSQAAPNTSRNEGGRTMVPTARFRSASSSGVTCAGSGAGENRPAGMDTAGLPGVASCLMRTCAGDNSSACSTGKGARAVCDREGCRKYVTAGGGGWGAWDAARARTPISASIREFMPTPSEARSW